MGRHSKPSPEKSVGSRGSRSALTAGGRRRDDSKGGLRGVSAGVVASAVAVVMVIVVVVGWRFFGGALSQRSVTAAQQCIGGTTTVAVVADPSIAHYVSQFAETFNADAAPVGDRCPRVVVTAAESDQVLNGISDQWPDDLGQRPALWIPMSSVSAARLQSVSGQQVISDARSLAVSPVVIAVRPELKTVVEKYRWGAISELQANPESIASLGMSDWGSLRLALPQANNADVTYLVGQAVAADAAPAGAPVTAGLGAMATLLASQPNNIGATSDDAWDVLVKSDDPATASVHAVAMTEQQLFDKASSLSDAAGVVAEWFPSGPAVLADYPTALLAGPWLSDEQVSAASEFSRFMRKSDQVNVLVAAGFRMGDTPPQGNAVVSFTSLAAPVSLGDDSLQAILADAMVSPVSSPVTTIMLNQQIPNLSDSVAALTYRMRMLPATASVGLWVFDGVDGRSLLPVGLLSGEVDGQPRAVALIDDLNEVVPGRDGGVSFTTLRLVYSEALADYVQGESNSVLVLTAGPHTDQTLDGPGLEQFVRSTVDSARPVAINVIAIGDDPDRQTWEAVAQLSGGVYRGVPGTDSPELTAAITALIS